MTCVFSHLPSPGFARACSASGSKGKAAQGRLESFFGPVTVTKKAAKEGEGKGKKGAG